MPDDRIALLLAHAQPSVVGPALDRLPGQHRPWSPGAIVDLVLHQLLKSHVIRRSDEYIRAHLLAGLPVIQNLVRAGVEPRLGQQLAEPRVFGPRVVERGALAVSPVLAARLAHDRLQELPDRHATRQCVWVDDDVGADPVGVEGHVRLLDDEADGAFLSATTTELVADHGGAIVAHPDLGDPRALLALRNKGLVHVAQLPLLGKHRCVQRRLRVLHVGLRQTDQHLLIVQQGVFLDQAHIIQIGIVVAGLQADHVGRGDVGEPRVNRRIRHLLADLVAFVGVVVGVAKQAAVQRGPIKQDGVLHVVAAVAGDRHDHVDAVGVLLVVDVLEIAALDERQLAVVQNHSDLVEPRIKVGVVHGDGLLALAAREEIAR